MDQIAQEGQGNHNVKPKMRWYRIYRESIWKDRGNASVYNYEPDPNERRELNIRNLDDAPFQWLVVCVAGTGFFVDGYLLFANNFALPILGFLYWKDDQHSGHETGINSATLSGAIVGQIVLGILADKYGRCKVYGRELMVIIAASIGMTMASTGMGSMRITGWLVFWRFVTGFGIGAEYPLTAVITSEFAPAPHRGRMLATVFSAQSLGQFFAALVAYLALDSRVPLDSAWRWVYGVATIPAATALLFRFTIPESPRYTWDVARNPNKADQDLDYVTHRHTEPTGEARFLPEASLSDFRNYLFGQGNWVRLLVTAGTWFLLDLSFFGLGLNSPQIVTGIFHGCLNSQTGPVGNVASFTWNSEPGNATYLTYPTPMLRKNETDFMLIVSICAISGSGLLILLVKRASRKRLQILGFALLAAFFFAIGAILKTVQDSRGSSAQTVVIIFYALAQFLFNAGPNALTFMFPAEIFPTRYRCTCHGMSAAAGKFGSVIAQLALRHVQLDALSACQNGPGRLGSVLLGFGAVMLLGAGLACLAPEVQNQRWKDKRLEDLALGRQAHIEGSIEMSDLLPGSLRERIRRRGAQDVGPTSENQSVTLRP